MPLTNKENDMHIYSAWRGHEAYQIPVTEEGEYKAMQRFASFKAGWLQAEQRMKRKNKEKRIMDAMKELQEWVGNNHTELADWAKEAENYTAMFENKEISEDEYKELMGDLKHSKAISDAADDLAVRSKANEMLDNIIIAAGCVL